MHAVLALLALGPALAAGPLPSWNDTALTRALIAFVDAATTPGTTAYVEPADRVATFDFDGTLSVEAPVYGQVPFCVWRVERERESLPAGRADAILRKVRALPADKLNDLSDEDTAELWGLGLSGESSESVQADARAWFHETLHPRLKRRREELLYAPMRELIAWLESRGFKVYVVTGSTLDFVRGISEELLGVPRENVIGSELERVYDEERPGRVERRPRFAEMVDRDRKVLEIDRRIGRRPLVAFGNSDGDVAMLTYAAAAPRRGFAAFVHHDDAVREYAYDRGSDVGALSRGLDVAAARGLRVVSMKDDWKRLF